MKEKFKKIAILYILIGIFVPIFSFLFASNYIPKAGIKYNLDRMEIVIYEGRPIPEKRCPIKFPSRLGYDVEEKCYDTIKYEGKIYII
ncbi:hypothetical protein COS61_02715 [Candidatus Wolfebacteria bacterium CG03_land_8_20_14_0_80_40_12]|uniref:Uncharacterized protein n=1 Tax=Candidatus Wolfebacteria bacterium CG03_land_8_20_14_0_80_40_12 TaxID=1975069 RepID=A0A2M7B4Z7_9BACT|nr:MAG: hypothetical protein COS61_02715 [Candidatus Wolfebacteria bacterium CG03_land_8_20_14_0_80_40_12]